MSVDQLLNRNLELQMKFEEMKKEVDAIKLQLTLAEEQNETLQKELIQTKVTVNAISIFRLSIHSRLQATLHIFNKFT